MSDNMREEGSDKSWSIGTGDGDASAVSAERPHLLRPAAAFAAVAGLAATQLLEPAAGAGHAEWDPNAQDRLSRSEETRESYVPELPAEAAAPSATEIAPPPPALPAAHAHAAKPLFDPRDLAGPAPRNYKGPLPQTVISSIVDRKRAELRRKCAGPNPTGHIVVSMVVAPSGYVYTAHTSGAPTSAAACFDRTVRSWHFPVSDAPTTVEIPFYFLSQ
jgi:hypothetical protein